MYWQISNQQVQIKLIFKTAICMEETEGEVLSSLQLTFPALQSRNDLVLWGRQKPSSKCWCQCPHVRHQALKRLEVTLPFWHLNNNNKWCRILQLIGKFQKSSKSQEILNPRCAWMRTGGHAGCLWHPSSCWVFVPCIKPTHGTAYTIRGDNRWLFITLSGNCLPEGTCQSAHLKYKALSGNRCIFRQDM